MFHSQPYVARFVLATLSFLLLAAPPHLSAQTNAENGTILFARQGMGEPGGEGLYTINADGTGERLLFLFSDLGVPYDIHNGGYRCPAWSPDGSQIAFNAAVEATNVVVVVDVATGQAERIVEVTNDDLVTRQIHYPEWVPNSSSISFGFTEAERTTGKVTANGVRMVELQSREITTIRDDITLIYPNSTSPNTIGGDVPNFLAMAHSWSPDGSELAIASYNDRVYLTDASGSDLRMLESSFWGSNDVDWSPDGARLVSSLHTILTYTPADTDRIQVWDPTGEAGSGTAPYYESVAWSPDGTHIAFATYWTAIVNSEFTVWNTISVLDVATGERNEILRTPSFTQYEYPYSIACVDWQPTGLAAAS
jgi:Tol biopolymer transport system component